MFTIDIARLREFISRSRTTSMEKEYWAREITSACERIMSNQGDFVSIDKINVFNVRLNEFEIIYTTPFSRLIQNKYGIDVWGPFNNSRLKVFSAQWEPMHITCFKRGTWMLKLFYESDHQFYII